jgi:DNA repair photolyase
MKMHNSKNLQPIVDIHASWIALNPIEGCNRGCKYCFLNSYNDTKRIPYIRVAAREAVRLLLEFDLYDENFPLALFTNTEIFATADSIKYAEEILEELRKNKIKNQIIFITKSLIPNKFLKKVEQCEKEGMSFLFMLSYSGLGEDIEQKISKEKIEQNFINLYKHNKKIVHYWRPFMPSNSTDEEIFKVLNFVKKYAICSVATGLVVNECFIDNLSFWKELIENKEKAFDAKCVWPKNAYEKVHNSKGDYSIFKTTPCALAYVNKSSNNNGFYKSKACLVFNNCSKKQRAICESDYKKKQISKIEEKLKTLLNKLKIEHKFLIDSDKNTIFIDNKLKTSQLVFLRLSLNMQIVAKGSPNDYYWQSVMKEDNILII